MIGPLQRILVIRRTPTGMIYLACPMCDGLPPDGWEVPDFSIRPAIRAALTDCEQRHTL